MIKVLFDPVQDSEERNQRWFAKWLQRADLARDNAIRAWEDLEENLPRSDKERRIWTDLKRWLLVTVFHNKCAYCEISFQRFYAIVDHYRPKGNISVEDDAGVHVETPEGRSIRHPGYFWLAYDWQNLLPACTTCNSDLKSDQFPTGKQHILLVKLEQHDPRAATGRSYPSKKWPGYYYLRTADLNELEKPYLLNPLVDDPGLMIRFMITGKAIPVKETDERATCSIRIYKLNLDDTQRLRRDKAVMLKTQYYAAKSNSKSPGDAKKEVEALLASYERGEEPFSAAALDALAEWESESNYLGKRRR